jgi:predicted HicB family RNase H-like nuclease
MKYLTYKGYHGTVEYSAEDGCLCGRVVGIADLISYEGETVKKIKACFESAVRDYLAYCEELGEKPQKPLSGSVALRIPKTLHRDISTLAELEGKSLNAWIAEQLKKKAEKIQRRAGGHAA